MNESNFVKVGMADLNVVQGAGLLKTMGLGSCVGVALIDAKSNTAGMAHVMLPTSDIAKEGELNLAKYADTAVPELVRRMRAIGANPNRMQAKLAGGSQMFSFASDTMRIGPRNVVSCKDALKKLGIPIIAEDTGGNFGRTIELDCITGILTVRSLQLGVKEM